MPTEDCPVCGQSCPAQACVFDPNKPNSTCPPPDKVPEHLAQFMSDINNLNKDIAYYTVLAFTLFWAGMALEAAGALFPPAWVAGAVIIASAYAVAAYAANVALPVDIARIQSDAARLSLDNTLPLSNAADSIVNYLQANESGDQWKIMGGVPILGGLFVSNDISNYVNQQMNNAYNSPDPSKPSVCVILGGCPKPQ